MQRTTAQTSAQHRDKYQNYSTQLKENTFNFKHRSEYKSMHSTVISSADRFTFYTVPAQLNSFLDFLALFRQVQRVLRQR